MVGGLGDISCFTFFAQKAMSLGEGGMICTNDAGVANCCRLRALNPWSFVSPGFEFPAEAIARTDDQTSLSAASTLRRRSRVSNGKLNSEAQLLAQWSDGYQSSMNELAAALGVAQLRRVTGMWQRRLEIAVSYNAAFSRFVELQCPADRQNSQHAWHSYLLRLNLQRLQLTRDQFLTELRARHIGAIVTPPPLHLQPGYAEFYGIQPEHYPVATQEYSREISLPIYSRMSDADVQQVVDAVEETVNRFRVGVKPR
jgi:perosamine synthetase